MASAAIPAARRNFEWLYVNVTVCMFVFAPELRRLVEWRGSGFSAIDIISVVPLFMLVPIGIVAARRSGRLANSPYAWLFAAWMVSFGYGFLLGWVQGSLSTGLYGLALFVLPLSVGAWLLTLGEDAQESFTRLTRLLFFSGSIAGTYGVIQFVFAPPWDTAWMQAIQATSFGDPVPFGIRVFSVLNSPQTFAVFVAAVLILTTATVNLRRWWVLPGIMMMAVSLALSLVRTAWIEVGVAVILLLVLNPRRLQAFASLGIVVAVSALGVALFLAVVPSQDALAMLTLRVNTFSSLSEDGSTRERQDASTLAFKAALDEPFGAGLGVLGVSNKLGDANLNAFLNIQNPGLDNGYVSRLYEQGVAGFLAFIGTLLGALLLTIDAYWRAAGQLKSERTIIASCLAFQVGVLVTLFGDDSLQGIGGVLYFMSVALPLVIARDRTLSSRSIVRKVLRVANGGTSWVSTHSQPHSP